MLGGDDQGRRQGGEPVGEQRREVGVGQVRRARGVLLPVPRGLLRPEAVGRGGVGVERGGGVEERVGQRHRREPARVPQCRDQGEVAAGAVAVDVRRAGRAPGEPGEHRVDVVAGRREAVLRRLAVADAQHSDAGPVRQHPGGGVVHVDVVEDEPAAVQVHDRPVLGARGPVEPAAHPVGVDVGDLGDVLARPGQRRRRGRRRARRGCRSRVTTPAVRRRLPPRRRGPAGAAPSPAPLGQAPSRASSSSTIAVSSLVKTGVGFSTGVPGSIGCRRQARAPA